MGILHNPSVKLVAEPAKKLYLARAVDAVLQSKDHVTPAMVDFMERLLDSENDFEKLDSDLKAIIQFIKDSKVYRLFYPYYTIQAVWIFAFRQSNSQRLSSVFCF